MLIRRIEKIPKCPIKKNKANKTKEKTIFNHLKNQIQFCETAKLGVIQY